MASIISAGNATSGVAISSDSTGTLDIKTGTGAATTAISINASQLVTMNGGVNRPLISDTVKTASGTGVDFTGIPSWVKRITVMFNAVVTSGSSPIIIKLGNAGGFEDNSYTGAGCNTSSGPTGFGGTANTVGFNLMSAASSGGYDGAAVLTLQNTLTWVLASTLVRDQSSFSVGGGNKATSATLTQIRITTVNGTDTFSSGSINILYE